MADLTHQILAAVARKSYQPLKPKALARKLGVPPDEHAQFGDWCAPFVVESSPEELEQASTAAVTYLTNLIEAKRWGLPVLCTNWDGFQQVVTHEEDGLFVDCLWDGETPELE